MRAILLAAGRGTRLQAADQTRLTNEQTAAAAAGAKAAMPLHGRLFLDYVLSGLADAGIDDICIVVRPNDEILRARYERATLARVRIRFVVQNEPRGTAHALLCAESIVGSEPFVVLNADNLYPTNGLARLRECSEPAMLAFSRTGLLRGGQITAERIAKYALVWIGPDGFLQDIVEKPEAGLAAGDDAPISMNVWRFDARIFEACRGLQPSSRGELELPNAVRRGIREMGLRIRALPIDAPVLDLSSRADVPFVTEKLAGIEVNL